MTPALALAIEAVEARLDAHEQRLDRLETALDALEHRFTAARRLSDTFAHNRDAAGNDRIARGHSVSADSARNNQAPRRGRYFDITRDEWVGPGDEPPPESENSRAVREERERRDTSARRARAHADAWMRGDA